MNGEEFDVGNSRQQRRITGPCLAAFLAQCARELREIEALMLANDERSIGDVRDAKGAEQPPFRGL